MHLPYVGSAGEEAVAAGVCAALGAHDVVYPGLRGVGPLLAMGAPPGPIMAELFGKATGLNGGKGGRLHLVDVPHRVMGVSGILAAGVPMAAGHALAAKLRGHALAVVCFVGDRATNQGVFHETLNVAALWQLPLLVVGVNNAPDDAPIPLTSHTAAGSMEALARAHGMATASADATDVLAVRDAARSALAGLRSGAGPDFLECRCYRLRELGATARAAGESEPIAADPAMADVPGAGHERDPLLRLERMLASAGADTAAALESARRAVDQLVAEAVRFARESPEPPAESAFQPVFAE
jgi:pyruvate dehydrogenase E1 component alpha subunit